MLPPEHRKARRMSAAHAAGRALHRGAAAEGAEAAGRGVRRRHRRRPAQARFPAADDRDVTAFATPRRLAVSITERARVAPDRAVRAQKLMPVSVAFDADGKPTDGARSKSIKRQDRLRTSTRAVERIERRARRQGGARVLRRASPRAVALRSALQEALDEALAKLPIPKVMSYASAGQLLQRREVRAAGAPAGGAARRGSRAGARARPRRPGARRAAIASCRAATSRSPTPTPTRRRSRPKAR